MSYVCYGNQFPILPYLQVCVSGKSWSLWDVLKAGSPELSSLKLISQNQECKTTIVVNFEN